jgi:predicted GH43/DUF377 family glycosyl hydrolase
MPLVQRFAENPILKPADVPYPVVTVHNAGVVKFHDAYRMVFRSHQHNGRSVLGLAESDDGVHFEVRSKPFLVPASEGPFADYEEYGVEDCRVCLLEDVCWLTYSAYSRYGVRIGLARTEDFRHVERVAMITQPDHRNIVLFPEKIGGRYARLDRPHTQIMPWSIWISYSPDLIYWGESRIVMRPEAYHWDEQKIGPGATPFRTDRGWLSIYHGVFPTMAGGFYRLGVALHDLSDPSLVLGVSDEFILQPQDPWEQVGYVPNVVFTCGAVPENDGTVKIYWGGADNVMCGGTARIADLVDLCLQRPRAPLG